MSFKLKCNESVPKGVRRIAREQIESAIEEIDEASLDRHEIVHQVRKRCKKIRGLIRLVRPRFPKTYRRENEFFRDAANDLSTLRDAESVVECFERLSQRFAGQINPQHFAHVQNRLVQRRQQLASEMIGIEKQLAEFRNRMLEARHRVKTWSFSDRGFKTVKAGLKTDYRRARREMNRAYAKPSTEQFHQWRKYAKYHWYHTRLLVGIWKPMMEAPCRELSQLADWLGDEHDLAVLDQVIRFEPAECVSDSDVELIAELISFRRAELRNSARALGRRLFAESPARFAKRWQAYWRAWQAKESPPIPITFPEQRVSA